MIIDELNEFANAVDASGAAGTALVGDVIDLGATPHDLGGGKPMYLVVQMDAAAAGGTSAAFELRSDADVAVADGSLHLSSGAVALASLTEGKTMVFPLPVKGGATPYERYLGLAVTRVGTFTTLTVNAFLTFDPTHWVSYADGQN